MRLTRLYIPDLSFSAGQIVPLSEDQSHYLLKVLRQEQGSHVILFNPLSGDWQASLNVTGKKALAVMEQQIQKPKAVSDIWLVMSPIRKESWEWAVEKSAELGVTQIQPALMDYTQNGRVNVERANANLIEASQQCERTDIAVCHEPKKLESILRNWDKERILYVALERSDAQPALDVFDKEKPGALLIGPEGGFSPAEKLLFEKYDFIKPISLGALILRAETAAISSLALWSAK